MERWAHAFGYSVPANTLERVGGSSVWDLMEAVIALDPGTEPAWISDPEVMRQRYVDQVNQALPKAIREMKKYKGMTSAEV